MEFAEGEATGEARGLIPAEEIEAAENRAGLIGPEEFYATIEMVLGVGGVTTGLQSLPIGEGEQPQARAATDVIYHRVTATDKAGELIYPRLAKWLFGPQSHLLGDLVVVGTFAGGKALAVRAEIAARRIEAATKRPRSAVPAGPDGDAPAGARAEPITGLSGEDVTLWPDP